MGDTLLQEMVNSGLPSVGQRDGKTMLELLRGISGAFRPGILTCLMGVSGAGIRWPGLASPPPGSAHRAAETVLLGCRMFVQDHWAFWQNDHLGRTTIDHSGRMILRFTCAQRHELAHMTHDMTRGTRPGWWLQARQR